MARSARLKVSMGHTGDNSQQGTRYMCLRLRRKIPALEVIWKSSAHTDRMII